jgi:hypothetical protein
MQPFMIESPSQFRAPPPPALTSDLYAANFNETKMYGSATSAVRTAAQTAIALFWNANAISQQNQLYRDVAVQHGLDLVDTVRLLAMGDMTVSDAGIACFDSKYHYLHWRPYTAIRNAGLDGNPATTADPMWTPLIATPNHPEYPSAHGCVTSTVTQVIAKVLGTSNIDVTIMGATLGGTALTTSQHFDTAQQLQDQLLDARVWAGLHWRNSDVVGENLGNALAGWVLQRYFRPLGADRGHGGDDQGDNGQGQGQGQGDNGQGDNGQGQDGHGHGSAADPGNSSAAPSHAGTSPGKSGSAPGRNK